MKLIRPCACNRVTRGRPFQPDRDCAPCWLFAHRRAVRAAWSGDPSGLIPVRGGGPDEEPWPPLRALRAIGPAGLTTTPDGYAFNAGLARYAGRLLLCYRVGWAGSDIHVAEVTEDLTPVRSVRLNLWHPLANYGREDPRLFVYRGRLHVSFTGVASSAPNGGWSTSVLYARLTDDLQVERVYAPNYCRRAHWEKNWVFFEHDGGLYCVYSIAPHVILRVDEEHAETAYETATPFQWSGGHLRGGATPVLVGDRWYHWFHGRLDTHRLYNVGCYTFETRPPFRVLALTPDPVLWADPVENARHPNPNHIPAVFPCGAVLANGVWRVGMGWNDREIRVAEWDAASIDALLDVPTW